MTFKPRFSNRFDCLFLSGWGKNYLKFVKGEEEEEEEEEKGSRREGVACWATGASGMAFVWILERLSCLIRYGLEIRPPRADSGEGSSYKTG